MEKDKIDFVLLWVDGSDPQWLEEKNKYSEVKSNVNDDIVRFRDWDNLKYWFRSVEKYAPWVNKIFFVTCGHYPKWLNINHPKLVLVNHKDYIPEKYLPTFSSHVIELNLHRIKELSDNFVYFNDDTFLTDYCNKEYFFKNGKPCDIAAINAIVPDHDDMFYQIMNNNWAVLNGYFNKNEVIKKDFFKWINLKYGTDLLGTLLLQPWSNFVGFRVSHMPTSLQKPTFEKLWELEKEKLDTTCLHKFRNITDLNQYVIEFYQVVSGNFFPRKKKTIKYYNVDTLPSNFKQIIKKRKYKMICINDSKNCSSFEETKKLINDSFEQNLYEKSSFEL